MGTLTNWLKQGLLVAGFVLLALVGLLLFAAISFAFRPLLIAAIIVTLLGSVVLAYFSPRFRAWFEALGETQVSYNGLRLATDVAVHPNHSWALISSENVAVGADDLVQAVLGPVDAVELPPMGSRVRQGERLFSLCRAGRRVDVRSPMSGTVVTTNQALLQRPDIINEGPFTGGWAVRLRPDNVREDRQRLFHGKQARSWFRHEIDRLIGTVLSEKAVMHALPDGGTLVPDLYRQIDDSAWNRLTVTFFGSDPKA
jgi:glycine cleavage system H protein